MSASSDSIGPDLERRAIDPGIPTRPDRKVRLTIERTAYAMRDPSERFFSKIDNSRRVATGYDKSASSLLWLVQPTMIHAGSGLAARSSDHASAATR
ncbi:hypothetical protein [Phreatobacter sp.]|uniref:hypothetical protein n=1 Tax=Phreatobacter sp. TaxID=1966341 RepID=UPI0025E54695|nr:hypothetical protein [Phreatobacter sp.]